MYIHNNKPQHYFLIITAYSSTLLTFYQLLNYVLYCYLNDDEIAKRISKNGLDALDAKMDLIRKAGAFLTRTLGIQGQGSHGAKGVGEYYAKQNSGK